ncbi:ExeA family protein [Porticoccus sp.]
MYYESYFDLKETPFSISPDPRYLYLTQNHREALAHLLYGVSSNGGFVLLTGEIGAGKTTVCQCLLEQLPANTDVAYILNPKLEPWEFLATICDELGISYPGNDTSLKHYIDLIHGYLLEAHSKGRNTVLMVDEAQNLSTELIEHLRLLTNLETSEKKLLQIMLVGQPELRDKIALPEMQQMAQRITARFHLGPLSKSEVAAYVRHRLNVAGAKRELFRDDSLNQLWRLTGGVPRLINIICDRALLGTYTLKRHKVDRPVLEDAAAEVLGRHVKHGAAMSTAWLWGMLAIGLAAAAFWATYYFRDAAPANQILPSFESAQSAEEEVVSMAPSLLDNTAADLAQVNELQSDAPPAGDDPGEPEIIDEASVLEVMSPPPVVVEDIMTPETAAGIGVPEIEASALADADLMQPFVFPQQLSSDALMLSAYSALFRRWNIEYLPKVGVEPCQFAAGRQLGCMSGQGNLPILLQLNRPSLLTLYDGAGRAYSAALIGVDEADVILILGGELRRVPLTSLSQWWYGEYQVLWQLPPGYIQPLKKGSSGTAVVWLLQQLGETINADPVLRNFDEQLEQQVKLFQRGNGLIPDGVVGPRTIIALNNASGAELPRLTESAKE